MFILASLCRLVGTLFPCHQTVSRFTRELSAIRSGKDSRLSAHDLLLFLPEFRILVIFGSPCDNLQKLHARSEHPSHTRHRRCDLLGNGEACPTARCEWIASPPPGGLRWDLSISCAASRSLRYGR